MYFRGVDELNTIQMGLQGLEYVIYVDENMQDPPDLTSTIRIWHIEKEKIKTKYLSLDSLEPLSY